MKFYYYNTGKVVKSLSAIARDTNTSSPTNVNTAPWKDIYGDRRTQMYWCLGSSSVGWCNELTSPMMHLTFVPSSSDEYDSEEYAPSKAIGVVSTQSMATSLTGVVYTLAITTPTMEDITIKSLKAKLKVPFRLTGYASRNLYDSLYGMVVLDEPVTIKGGTVKTITVAFDFFAE